MPMDLPGETAERWHLSVERSSEEGDDIRLEHFECWVVRHEGLGAMFSEKDDEMCRRLR